MLSCTVSGWAMVSMPSCTVPMSSKMPFTVHMIQPDMLWMRITRPVASVIAPTLIRLSFHSHSARPHVPTIRKPLITAITISRLVVMRVCPRCFSASSWIASAT
ncbi:hypothetical protein D3C81_1556580 [compost metagenome]